MFCDEGGLQRCNIRAGFFFLGDQSSSGFGVFLDRAHGTHRWFHVSGIAAAFELAKPALILFLAWFCRTKPSPWTTGAYAASGGRAYDGISGADVFQRILERQSLRGITACVLFVAGIRLRWFGYAIWLRRCRFIPHFSCGVPRIAFGFLNP